MEFSTRTVASTILVVLAIGISQAAHAQTQFDFTFTNGTNITDVNNNPLSGTSTASGTLFATSNGDGSYTVTSGSVTVTGFDAGTYNLVANPNAPGHSSITGTTYFYDDQLFLNSAQVLSYDGLLFGTNGGVFYNLYNTHNSGSPANTYQFYDNNLNYSNGASGSFMLTQVPEPSAMLGLGGMGVVSGLAFLRRRRSARKAV